MYHLCAAGGESFHWLCLGITNILATRIPAVGILSSPPSVSMFKAPVRQKQFLADTTTSSLHMKTPILLFILVCVSLLELLFSSCCNPFKSLSSLAIFPTSLTFIFPPAPVRCFSLLSGGLSVWHAQHNKRLFRCRKLG